jgi:hypothetical protein
MSEQQKERRYKKQFVLTAMLDEHGMIPIRDRTYSFKLKGEDLGIYPPGSISLMEFAEMALRDYVGKCRRYPSVYRITVEAEMLEERK